MRLELEGERLWLAMDRACVRGFWIFEAGADGDAGAEHQGLEEV